MANFILTYYSGSDGYSDGDAAENYILNALKEGKTIDDIPREEMSWPVYYHLTPVREGICNWYPFRKDASILEIGSGCGAITGVLCRNASKVTSVELSKRRASINYERNKQYQNLDIIVGNLNDIELDEKYDYITLIGVLEYAGKFTDSERPFHTFLENMKKYLKPDGAILIAIENRLGLKYFSGAVEDHTGRVFDGINSYPQYEGVRTFSKSELTDLLSECGFRYNRFYYPYPDYKLPNEIFTDSSINKNKRPYQAYDVDRYSIFWESEMSNTLQKEGVASVFANSFFVEVRENDECDSSFIYAKLNQDRKEEFRVGTIISETDGEKLVEKRAFHSDATKHIDRIFENDRKKYGTVSSLSGEKSKNGILYPYIKDITLGEKLKDLAMLGKKDEFVESFRSFFDEVFSEASIQKVNTAGFLEVFGAQGMPEQEMECVCPANIDIAPNNVFCIDDSYVLTDCEWVFEFPIPVKFIAWRAVRTVYVNAPGISVTIKEKELLEKLGITEEDVELFEKWEDHFVRDYVYSVGQGVPKSTKFVSVDFERYENLEKDISELRETIASLNETIASARQFVSVLSQTGAFKMVHLHKRIKEQFIKGSQKDKKDFFSWLMSHDKSIQNMDTTYNYALQLDGILSGHTNIARKCGDHQDEIKLAGAKRIDIITPGHTMFLAKQLAAFLKGYGIQSEIHDPNFTNYERIPYIVICANIMQQLPPCYICYQMEQTINSRWLSDRYISVLENSKAVLDYSKVNIAYFDRYEEVKNKIYYVPMGVAGRDIEGSVIPDNQDIDVLFYGDINCDRRKRIIDELSMSFNVHVESDLFGDAMLNVIRRSKVVINIHYYEGALLETPRISEILSLGTSVIVSEKSRDPEEEKRMADYVDLVEVDDVEAMKDRIAFWLNNNEARRDKIEGNKKGIVDGKLDAQANFERFLRDQAII